jgi:hypothetical protein
MSKLAMRGVLFAAFAALSPSVLAVDATLLQEVLAQDLPPVAAAALADIPEPGRKLLAARSYHRAKTGLESRWSWDQARIASYEGSAEQQALLAQIASVAAHFAAANPGYTLYTNTRVRSLDEQLKAWNSNASVGASGDALLASLASAPEGDLGAGNPERARQLQAWLHAQTPQPAPTLAAPGLSAHGQMRAIDFQVMAGGEVVAGTDSTTVETIWRTGGWAEKLKASITQAGPAFEGPLASPDEPWHYTYLPSRDEPAPTAPP